MTKIAVDAKTARLGVAWACLGAALALVVQSDIYCAFTLLGAFALLVLYMWWLKAQGIYRNAAIAIGTMVVLCVPFVLQRLLEHPDLPVRYGIFHVQRLRPLFDLQRMVRSGVPLAVLGCTYGLARVFRVEIDRLYGNGWARSLRGLVIFFCAIIVLGYAAMPISTIVLGKAIQIYHFPWRARDFSTYANAACLILGLDFVCRSIATRVTWPATARMTAAVGLLVLLCLGTLYSRARGRQLPPRATLAVGHLWRSGQPERGAIQR